MLLVWLFRIMADKEADISPGFILIQSIERMTCTDTRFAAGAGIEIDLECELFPRVRFSIRNQFSIESRSLELDLATARLSLCEAINKRQLLLLSQQHLQ